MPSSPFTPPPLAPGLESGALVRARATLWISAVIGVLCGSESIILALHASDVYPSASLAEVPNAWFSAGGCAVASVLAFAARAHFERVEGSRAGVVLSVGMAVITGLTTPTNAIDTALPQVLWAPVIVAAILTTRRWIYVNVGIVLGLYVLRVPEAPAFHGPAAWVIVGGLLALVATLRWLHDEGLREAGNAHAHMLDVMFHDTLTHLPNRHAFVGTLEALGGKAAPARAVLRIDLEQFSLLNDTLGRAAGDDVLKAVARELQSEVSAPKQVARAGADDFLVLLTGEGALDAEAVAAGIVARLETRRTVGERAVHLTAHVGVATTSPGEDAGAETLLQRADQALLLAKKAGRRRIATLRTAASENPTERAFEIAQSLHTATDRGEISNVYQPILDLRTGRIVKAEALARWTHPRLGAVGPGEFIPVAEATGTIHAIGDWVLRTAAAQLVAWRAQGMSDFRVSVNHSPVQFREDDDGTHPCLKVLAEVGAPADGLVVEITEGVILDADAATRRRLTALRATGVRLSLDDFGTGYSSIGALHSFEIDALKIDRRFVHGLARGSKEYVLCDSIIRMAHALGLSVVAEGIETEQQLELLRAMGCDQGQGYFLGRPMQAAALTALLAAQLTSTPT